MSKATAQQLESIFLPQPVPYREMLDQQIARRDAVRQGAAPNTLFLLEHPPTITLGRKTNRQHLLLSKEAYELQGITVEEVDRGGDVTYHGPGQLVAYPILDLTQWRPSVGWYIRRLEEVIIRTISDYGLKGDRLEGYTGVWVDGAKIAAIGVGLHHWISFHGIALNLTPNMDHFKLIIPCGIADKPVTSMAALIPRPPTIEEAQQAFDTHFRTVFSE